MNSVTFFKAPKSALNTWPKVLPRAEKSKDTKAVGITEYIFKSGLGWYKPTSSHTIPSTHVIRMPKRMPPLTFLISRKPVMSTPRIASRAPIPTELKSVLKFW